MYSCCSREKELTETWLKFNFSNLIVFSICCCRPKIFLDKNSAESICSEIKGLYRPIRCRDIGVYKYSLFREIKI